MDVNPARQVKSPIPGALPTFSGGPREGIPRRWAQERSPPSRGGSSLPGFSPRNGRRARRKESKSGRERFITGRKRETDWLWRETSALLRQPFLYPINGELSPGGRGPQFIFSPQLGSCGHIVEGVSWSGGHIVLRNWHQQRKTGYCLKEKQDAR